jgi:hypothetical protein
LKSEARQYPPTRAGKMKDKAKGVGTCLHLRAGLLDAGGEPLHRRVPRRGQARVDGPAELTVFRCLDVHLPADLDHLAVHGDDSGGRVDLKDGQSDQLAPPSLRQLPETESADHVVLHGLTLASCVVSWNPGRLAASPAAGPGLMTTSLLCVVGATKAWMYPVTSWFPVSWFT